MSDTIWKSTAVLLKVSWLVRFFVGNNGTRTEPTMRQRCQYLVATTHPFSSSRAPPVTKHKNLTYTPFKAYRVAPTLTRQCVPHPQSRRPRATHKVASTMYDPCATNAAVAVATYGHERDAGCASPFGASIEFAIPACAPGDGTKTASKRK